MKQRTVYTMLLVAAIAGLCGTGAATAGQVRAWGWDSDGQISTLPAGNSYIAIAAGDSHGLALRSDGAIIAWGQNDHGECTVPAGTYRTVAAGAEFSLAIRTNGSLAAWGNNSDGQVSKVPAGTNFVAVDGGETWAVALKSDGTIAAWGSDSSGQVTNAPKGNGFKAVVAGDSHGVALRSNGALVTWGYAAAIQGTPTTGTFTAIGAGGTFCVALRSDGSLAWWGTQAYDYGLARVPTGKDYVAISAGYLHCLALKKDGSVVGWGAGTDSSGHPNWGQANPPAGTNFTAIAAGLYYSLALAGDSGTSATAAITDNFDDNKQGILWVNRVSDRANCWLDETNQRLELRATSRAKLSTAYYVTNNWKLDPANDFSFKISFHYSLRTEPLGWISVGLTPDINDLNAHHVEFGPGCGKSYPHVWYEAIDGTRTEADFVDRDNDNGMLYVSYDAKADKLYLSTNGYGARYAWGVVSDLLRGSWGDRPVWLYIGGGSDGQEIKSGEAYFDSFAMESGGPTGPTLASVHRFWSPSLLQHFFTVSQSERDKLLKNYPKTWTYEGPVFQAAIVPTTPGLAPVYRFWSTKGEGHFFTVSESEKNKLIDRYAQSWTYEGVAFYAYPEGSQPATSKPVYRFWQPAANDHFYTTDTAERDLLIKTYSKVYTFEGVAFYAF